MTFTDAAAEVLRQVGRPLHYKEITAYAIEKNLLSHVGKSPEVTMGARLAALFKKEGEDNGLLVRVKPGVFALKEWEDSGQLKQMLAKPKGGRTAHEKRDKGGRDSAESDSTDGVSRDAAEPVVVDSEPSAAPSAMTVPEPMPQRTATAQSAAELRALAGSAPETSSVDQARHPEGKPPRARQDIDRVDLAAGAAGLFEEEEDDDQPILGGAAPETASERDVSRRRRRRRRRGAKGGETAAN